MRSFYQRIEELKEMSNNTAEADDIASMRSTSNERHDLWNNFVWNRLHGLENENKSKGRQDLIKPTNKRTNDEHPTMGREESNTSSGRTIRVDTYDRHEPWKGCGQPFPGERSIAIVNKSRDADSRSPIRAVSRRTNKSTIPSPTDTPIFQFKTTWQHAEQTKLLRYDIIRQMLPNTTMRAG